MRTILLVVCALLPGCKKEHAEGVANAQPARHHPAVAVASPTPSGTPTKTTPKELFADFTRPDADGLALLDKYRDGATFTGLLQSVSAEDTDTPILMMSVDGKNVISLAFTRIEQARGHKAGDVVTVTCKIGGASGALMMVTDCVL